MHGLEQEFSVWWSDVQRMCPAAAKIRSPVASRATLHVPNNCKSAELSPGFILFFSSSGWAVTADVRGRDYCKRASDSTDSLAP